MSVCASVTEIVEFFCPQVQLLLQIITFQSLQIITTASVNNIKPCPTGPFGKQHGMCAEFECRNKYTRVKQKTRAGAIVSAEAEGRVDWEEI